MEEVWAWFYWLKAEHGIKLTVFYDEWDRSRLIGGLYTTIKLSTICVIMSVLIGVLGAWLQSSRNTLISKGVWFYISFFRNTPPLVQLYFFYFAVDRTLASAFDIYGGVMSNFQWAVLSLSFFAGAFNVEIFRAGLEAVPKTTVEAAESLGYSPFQTFTHVTFPLAYRVCLPALNNNLINLVKTTTVAYAIATPELLYVSNQIWSEQYNAFEMMNVVWVLYLCLVGILVWLMHRWERAVKVPGFGQ